MVSRFDLTISLAYRRIHGFLGFRYSQNRSSSSLVFGYSSSWPGSRGMKCLMKLTIEAICLFRVNIRRLLLVKGHFTKTKFFLQKLLSYFRRLENFSSWRASSKVCWSSPEETENSFFLVEMFAWAFNIITSTGADCKTKKLARCVRTQFVMRFADNLAFSRRYYYKNSDWGDEGFAENSSTSLWKKWWRKIWCVYSHNRDYSIFSHPCELLTALIGWVFYVELLLFHPHNAKFQFKLNLK